MRTPPRLEQTDAEAQDQANEAVERGTNLIRSHLSNHIVENPDSSFVTWIATLHPENADVSIDHRFFVPRNPWWTVYEEAKHELPSATAVPIEDVKQHDSAAAAAADHKTSTATITTQANFCYRCSPLDMIVGFSLSFSAILTVAMMEFIATVIYMVSALFYQMATALSPPNIFTGIFYSIFLFTYSVFALVDSVLLVTSIVVTEFLAGTAFILSICLGGISMAFMWHQYIRRTCHLARWAFRSPFTSPHRHLVFCGTNRPDDDDIAAMIPTPSAPSSQQQQQPHVIIVDEANVTVPTTSKEERGSTKSLI